MEVSRQVRLEARRVGLSKTAADFNRLLGRGQRPRLVTEGRKMNREIIQQGGPFHIVVGNLEQRLPNGDRHRDQAERQVRVRGEFLGTLASLALVPKSHL